MISIIYVYFAHEIQEFCIFFEIYTVLISYAISTSSLSDLSVRSEDCKKLRIKISVSEENSELFDEETGIFRPIYCNRSRTVLSPTGC